MPHHRHGLRRRRPRHRGPLDRLQRPRRHHIRPPTRRRAQSRDHDLPRNPPGGPSRHHRQRRRGCPSSAAIQRRRCTASRATSRCRSSSPTAASSARSAPSTPSPPASNTPEIIGMFKLFAELIAFHLNAHGTAGRQRGPPARRTETSELREQFIAVLGHDLRNPLAAIERAAATAAQNAAERQGHPRWPGPSSPAWTACRG